jgi:hypothetical protein
VDEAQFIGKRMVGAEVRMDDASGRHFKGPVPSERECAGQTFQIVNDSKDSEAGATFRCLRCGRNLDGLYLPHGKSRLNRPGRQIP